MTNVIASNPSFVCQPERGCREEQAGDHYIGRGVKITLPQGWTYFSYPQAPIPEMAGLRGIRAFKGNVVIAITPVPNIDRRTVTEEGLRDLHAKATARYVAQSREGTVKFVSMSRDDLVGGYASFTAINDGERPFAVLANRQYASVTSFIISCKFVFFSVSVASERLPDEDYTQALNAILNITY